MSGYPKLRTNSPAHIVLCRLVDLGGSALLSKLIDVLSAEQQRISVVHNRVIAPLLERGYVVKLGDSGLRATSAGKDYAGSFLGRNLPRFERYEGTVAVPRTVPAFRPLNLSKIYPAAVYREDAFDHRNIPSMMGGGAYLSEGL